MIKKIIFALIALGLVLATAAFSAKRFVVQQWQLPRDAQVSQVTVNPGDTYYAVASRVFEQSFSGEWWLRAWFRFNPETAGVRSGTFAVDSSLSLEGLSDVLRNGTEIQLQVTLVEGETFQEFWQKLNGTEGIVASELTETEVAELLGSERDKLEGLLLPETYFFVTDTPAEEIVKRAYQALEEVLEAQWQARAEDLPINNAYEALILASIIEKETGAKHERPRIASVFVNRLNIGMRLQTDPTVIYGMGDRYNGRIRRADLREATAYNTYVIPALPPTPIAMASEDAIHAALNPEHSPYFYFVAKGGGEHYFSKTLKEHNRAVRKYILGK